MKKYFLGVLCMLFLSVLVGCQDENNEAPIITVKNGIVTEFAQNSVEPDWYDYIDVIDDIDEFFNIEVDDSNVDMSKIGTFEVILNVTDSSGNKATPITIEITIVDRRAPSIVLKDSANLFYPEGSSEPDWSNLVEVNDNYDETVSLVIDDSNVDMNTIGTFEITYNSTDSALNKSNEFTITITIYDIDAPLIYLDDSAILEYVEQSTAPNWGDLVNVIDNYDTDLNVIVDSSNVDMNTIGTFDVIFDAIDTEGNEAISLVVAITITDGTSPTVTLKEDAITDYTEGTSIPNWEDLVNAEDNHDSAVILNIDSSVVDMSTIGSYEISYTAVDTAGNTSSELSVMINILDGYAPTITINDEADLVYYSGVITFTVGSEEPEWLDMISVTDNYDIVLNPTFDASLVDMTTLGTYNVTYDVSDAQGNHAETFNLMINIMDMEINFFDFETAYNNTGWGFTRQIDPLDETGTNYVMRPSIAAGHLKFTSVNTIGKDVIFEYDFAVEDFSANPAFGLNLSTYSFNNNEKIFFRYLSNEQVFSFVQRTVIPTVATNYTFSNEIYFPLEENTYYNFRLELYGTYMYVYIDNQLIFEGPAIPLDFSEQVLISTNQKLVVDNVKITTFDLDPLEDTTAPIISQNPSQSNIMFSGQSEPVWETMVVMNENFNLPYVLTIDDSAVDMNTVGTFDVIYQATDHQGNISDEFVLPVTILEFPLIEEKVDAILTYEDNDPTPIWEDLVNITHQGDLVVGANLNGNDLTVPGDYVITITLSNELGLVITSVDVSITVTASDEYLLNQAKENIDLGDISGIISDIVLPLSDPNGAIIYWESNNSAISANGVVTRPSYSEGDIVVILTANIVYSSETTITTTRTFEVTVLSLDPTDAEIVAEAKDNLDLGDISAVTGDLSLPLTDLNGATITWVSDNPAITNDGIVTRDLSGNVIVTLTATITYNGETDTKVFIVTVLQAVTE